MFFDPKFIEQLTAAAHVCGCTPEFAGDFSTALAQQSPAQLARINPLRFADVAGLDRGPTLDLFISAAKAGLFSFEWGLVCPLCGKIGSHSDSINDVTEDFHCAFCARDVETVLDDTVEVTFSLDTSCWAGFNRHADFATNFRYSVSSSFLPLDAWLDYHQRHTVADALLGIGEAITLRYTPQPGEWLRLYSLDLHSSVTLRTTDVVQSDTPQSFNFFLKNNGFGEQTRQVEPRPLEIQITNASEERVWVQLLRLVIPEIMSISARSEPHFGTRLTGQRLLTNQVFREQYGLQRLIPDLRLRVKTVCLLFTDLKGSTAMYDRNGDLEAYHLVQKHFEILRTVVRQHAGAIVKTMGDAIMAAFPDPENGVRAAMDMLSGIQQLSRDINPESLGLKVGLHAGPVLTVNSGGLDFFGQTVNIAARVQGLAEAGEICLTDAVRHAPRCEDILRERGFTLTTEVSKLKGVEQERRIVRCVPR